MQVSERFCLGLESFFFFFFAWLGSSNIKYTTENGGGGSVISLTRRLPKIRQASWPIHAQNIEVGKIYRKVSSLGEIPAKGAILFLLKRE